MVEFDWFPGFSIQQHQRSISSFHDAARTLGMAIRPLEVSTRSPDELGRKLSAFNLRVEHPAFGVIPLESAFQSSKVFNDGGPYVELAQKDPRTAKRDPRIQHPTGSLCAFRYDGTDYPLQPTTSFYDWLYIRSLALVEQADLDELCQRDGFTDIAFNPEKSVNCQAYSVALFVSLTRDGYLHPWDMNFQTFVNLACYASSKPQLTQQTFID
jgi:type I restriction enzyme M protein